MVLDEELKMMSRICNNGGMIIGPLLKEMKKTNSYWIFIKW